MLQVVERAEPVEMRRHGRHRVMLSARLHTPDGASAVVLLDLSQGGAMLALSTPLPRGSHVVLARKSLEAHGTVAWTQGRRCGIAFDEPVDDAIVDETVSGLARSAH